MHEYVEKRSARARSLRLAHINLTYKSVKAFDSYTIYNCIVYFRKRNKKKKVLQNITNGGSSIVYCLAGEANNFQICCFVFDKAIFRVED